MPVPRVRNSESISSKNTMTGTPSSLFSRARSKISRIWRSVSPTYLLRSSGPLMLRKYERVFVVARLLGDALRERVRDRLGDERLAATRRAVQQDALRRLQLVLVEQVGVQVRQLDRVLDLLDLVVEAADVGVGDVGDLFEDELLDLGPRERSTSRPERRVHRAGGRRRAASRRSARRRARTTRSSSARPTISARVPSSSSSLKTTTSPGDLGPAGEHDVQRLVEHDLLAALELVDRRARGGSATRILRPAVKMSTVPSSFVPRNVP